MHYIEAANGATWVPRFSGTTQFLMGILMTLFHGSGGIVRFCMAGVALLVGLSETGNAQFRIGPGGRAPRPVLELQREPVQEELGLTAEQLSQVGEVAEALNQTADTAGEVFARLREAATDEERQEILAEMRLAMREREAKAREMLAEFLDEQQMQRLNQIILHRQGPAALAEPDVADALALTDEQREEIAGFVAEQQASLRGPAAFSLSREDRQQLQSELNERILGVLGEDQLTAWNEQIGPPPPDAGERPMVAGPNRPRDTAPEAERPDGDEVVSSFESSDPNDSEKMSFNFKHAPWTDVLTDFAERAKLTLDLTATPPGTFSYFDRRPLTSTEVLDVLNGYLLQRGFILVHRDDFLVCINIDDGVPPNLIPYVTASELLERGNNELLTVVFPVKGAEIKPLAEQVGEMLGPQGKSVGIEEAEALVVTDIGSNLRRVHEMLDAMSALAGPKDVTFQAYPLEHIPAQEAEQLLRELLGLTFAVTNVSVASERRRWGQQQGGNNNGGDDKGVSSPFDGELLAKTQFTSNTRTNQLLVTAPGIVQKLVSEALESIDVEADGSYAAGGDGEPYLQVYQVSGTDAGEVTKTLDVLMPGVVVNEDRSSGKVHIFATAKQQREVAELIEQLQGKGGTQTVSVIPLVSMDPLAAAATVRAMFIGDGETAPVVEADLSGRQLMLRGTADQLAQVKTLLAQLGEDGTGDRSLRNRGPMRRFSLSGRNTQRLLEIIEGAWGATQRNPIRILPAENNNPIRDIRTPDDRSSNPSDDPRAPAAPEESDEETEPTSGARIVPERPRTITRVRTQLTSLQDATVTENESGSDETDLSPNEEAAPEEEEGSSRDAAPEILIRIDGDELVLMSSDQEALNRLEILLEDALELLPAETGWTVFTLQSADAIEAANMLELLIPDSTVSEVDASTTVLGTLQGFGSNLVESVGLDTTASSLSRLQIIPESRLNALFVSGPPSRIDEVSRFLEIIDASDWPGSKRDRVPRMIPVNHADIEDVHKIVSDVYSDYLAIAELAKNPFAGGGGGRGGNPIAMLLGGGGGNDAQTIDAPLTIGIDEQTSHLVVSADEPLFQEIRELVESIDKAADDANRTIRVYSLQNTNAAIVQDTLGSVMPRVKVSTTRTRTSNDRSSQTSPQAPPNGSGQADQVRQFFEQRMRERFQQMQRSQQQPSGDSGRRDFRGSGRDRRGRGRDDRGN